MISTARKPPSGPLTDPDHHIGAALAPPSPSPSPLGPPPSSPPMPKDPLAPARTDVAPADVSVWLRWAVSPSHALALLAAPLLLAPAFALLARALPAHRRPPNPFTPFFLLSHAAPPPERILAATTAPRYTATTPLYVKGPGDLLLVAWSVVLFSFLRLLLARQLFPALAKRWGIRKEGKQIRFGEQGYAVVYWAVFGAWGVYIMSTSRTHWFQTSYFWADYPHTHLSGAMKRYYLSQIAYWVQQGGVLALGLEKRRSDFWEYVLHHLITVWMVSWSYLMNVTLLGNAVFISMDIPDTGLAFSKCLNYLQLDRAKVVSLGVFTVVWTYFRHFISIRILWSLLYEFDLVPKYAQVFAPSKGLYMATWMRDQMFYTLCILQALNIFWYYLIIRVIVRSIRTSKTEDNRSEESEPEGEDEAPPEKGLPPSIAKSKKGGAARTGAGAGLTAAPATEKEREAGGKAE
ncbi:longevity assurance proteins LAG1/LAC1 [Mycena belliarum]|uniref:Longevity assurance proteins LAG1/LAC1 n=1 Tax=Mycena belliarum TaxID=1033014 RepID=A0AAD6U437_9AGAR|nr:longevity assurance proteins LAG1/LAC1 [Mycena belliae]